MKEIDEEELRAVFEGRMTLVDIADRFGVCVVTVRKRLKAMGLTRVRAPKYEDITGSMYGRLTVLRFDHLDKFGKAHWLTRCVCGKEKLLNASAMKAGLTTSCGCYKQEAHRKGIGNLSHAYWHKLEKAALQRDLPFTITKQEAWEKFNLQNGMCALSGVPIALFPNWDRYRLQTASIDRVDSTRGYVPGNIQWVHKRVNFLKRDYSEQELIFWCYRIAERNMDRLIDISSNIPAERRPLHEGTSNIQTP